MTDEQAYDTMFKGCFLIIADYILAKECKNPDAWYTCHKCGACGRVFEDGFMVDSGGTTLEEEE